MEIYNSQLSVQKSVPVARFLMAESGERKSVLSEPGSAAGSTLGRRVSVALAQSTGCLASGGLAAQLAMFLLRLADPLDLRISADGGVSRVDHDDFIVFVGRVFTNPVGIEDAERPDLATNTFLGNRLKRALELHLVDAMMGGLAVSASLGHGLLAGTAANTDAIDDESLLRAVSQSARFLDTRGLSGPVHARQLTVLPRAHAQKKSHHVRLLLTPKFVDIFISAHGWALKPITILKIYYFKQIETTQL